MHNNVEQLKEYKRIYGLNSKQIADILGVSVRTVKSWLLKPESPNYRPMSDSRANHLKLRLRTRKKVNT